MPKIIEKNKERFFFCTRLKKEKELKLVLQKEE
jgi:hypothetical protein